MDGAIFGLTHKDASSPVSDSTLFNLGIVNKNAHSEVRYAKVKKV